MHQKAILTPKGPDDPDTTFFVEIPTVISMLNRFIECGYYSVDTGAVERLMRGMVYASSTPDRKDTKVDDAIRSVTDKI